MSSDPRRKGLCGAGGNSTASRPLVGAKATIVAGATSRAGLP
jgi:hypothetical protein